MSKDPIPLTAPDISLFARSLASQLKDQKSPPSHLSLMNILARAVGFRNYQHMRAAQSARSRLVADDAPETTDYRLVERVLQHFDNAGCLLRWPSRQAVQEICLWVLWAKLPAAQHMHERDVNACLNQLHQFGDAPLLRRSLIGLGLMDRNQDGSDYLRMEKRPPVEAREVIRRVAAHPRADSNSPRTDHA